LMTLKDSISLRATSKGIKSFFSIIFPKFKSRIPSYATINRWIKRVGLYNLRKPLEQASDWIAIADTSISIGTQKVVMIEVVGENWTENKVKLSKNCYP
ncbi:MAG TPA: hypothetical protein VGP47_05310, partial [Parachlamydiaceae bacterium]|nr:hypothetical protein [Parachlamydiaceae bacterium]